MRDKNPWASVEPQTVANERVMVHHHAIPSTGPAGAVAEPDGHAMTTDDRELAMLLITAWATRTGRVLRPAPVSELTPEELVNFWADDQLEKPLDMPVREWLR